MTGKEPTPVIRVNHSGISGEGPECARNSPFPWPPVKDGNAATTDVINVYAQQPADWLSGVLHG